MVTMAKSPKKKTSAPKPATKRAAKAPAKAARPSTKASKPAASKSATPSRKPAAKPVRSAGKPLSASQLEAIRARLQEERQRLRGRLGYQADDDESSDAANVGDIADAATYLESRELRRGLQLAEMEQLDQVEAALVRIEKGVYGKCVTCALPIEGARLEVLPQAPTCIACKQKEERGQSAR